MNAHIGTWAVQSNENVIPYSADARLKNDDYTVLPEEHRRIKKEMSMSSKKKGDGAADIDTSVKQDAPAKKSGVSENSVVSPENPEARSKALQSVVDYDKPSMILKYALTPMEADSKHRKSDAFEFEANLKMEPEMSSNLAEKSSISETDAGSLSGMSGRSFNKFRRSEENNSLGLRGQHHGSNSFSNDDLSSVSESDKTESLHVVGERQIIQHVTENMTDDAWRNDVLKNEDDVSEAEQFGSHTDDNDQFNTVDNTEANFWFSRSRFDHANSQGNDGDGSTKYAFTDSVPSQENEPHILLYNFNNGVEPRYVISDHAPSYYVQNPPAAAHIKSGWNGVSQLCAVPCSPMNYQIQPYASGSYGSGLGQIYATVGQVPHVELPPVQFPEIRNGNPSGVYGVQVGSAAAYGGTTSYGGASHAYVEEPMNHLEYSLDTPQKYVHTSLLMKAPQPSHGVPYHSVPSLAMSSHDVPSLAVPSLTVSSHSVPSLAVPSLAVPPLYTRPHFHHAQHKDINLHKSTYF